MFHFVLVLTLLVTTPATMRGLSAVDYSVTNNASTTAGGDRFNQEVGDNYTLQTLPAAKEFIWSVFHQNNTEDIKDVQKVSLFIDDSDVVAYADINKNEIHVNANYIAKYTGDLKREITGILYHEMAHIWQWHGNGLTPGGLIEGIADFVRLKAEYAPSHWVQTGQGDRWDQGYDGTARFLDYCNGLSDGFVAQLNEKMSSSYSAQYFVDLLGKGVDDLWIDYKTMYGN